MVLALAFQLGLDGVLLGGGERHHPDAEPGVVVAVVQHALDDFPGLDRVVPLRAAPVHPAGRDDLQPQIRGFLRGARERVQTAAVEAVVGVGDEAFVLAAVVPVQGQ